MTSLWLEALDGYATQALVGKADVAIVGGGLVGLSIALALAESGRAPLVIERDRVGAGASAHNGGLLLPGTAELYLDLVARWGRPTARLLWAATRDGAATLAGWMTARDVGFRPEGGLHVAASPAEAERLLANQVGLVADGFDATWLTTAALAGFSDLPLPEAFLGALMVPGGGPLHSGRLLAALAGAATAAGARLVEGVPVAAVTAAGRGWRLDTAAGRVQAETLILASNAWTGALAPELAPRIVPVRGQVLATAALGERGLRAGWYVNDGYEYFQQLPDGRLVAGGWRWAAPDREVGHDQPALNPALQAGLARWLETQFPAWAPLPVTHRWSGIMAFTRDRLPLIGPLPGAERAWVAAGFNGHGLPFAPLAARLLSDALSGRLADPIAERFRPDRATLQVPGPIPA